MNRVHYTTRKPVLRRLLLFNDGDVVDERTLEESERILREQSWIADADIRAVEGCDGKVDLEVITREVWTLIPELSFKSTGGHNEWHVGIRDSNFLGSGRRVTFGYKSDRDRDSTELHYLDENFRGKHMTIRVHWTASSDGHERLVQTGLPFYQLDSKRSWFASASEESLEEFEYQSGDKVGAVAATYARLDLSRGFSQGLIDDVTRRYTFGATVDRRTYDETAEEPLLSSRVPDICKVTHPRTFR